MARGRGADLIQLLSTNHVGKTCSRKVIYTVSSFFSCAEISKSLWIFSVICVFKNILICYINGKYIALVTSSMALCVSYVLEIEHLLLEQSSYTCPLTQFVFGHLPPWTENVFHCSRHRHLVTLALGTVYKVSYLLSYILLHTVWL